MNNILLKRLVLAVLVIIIILLGVLVINRYIESNINTSTSGGLLFENVKLADITKFVYVLPDNELVFEKKQSLWYVNNNLASTKTVEIALSKLLAVQINYVASQDESNYSIFDVNNSKSKLILQTTTSTLNIFIGKNTFADGSFVRFENSTSTLGTDVGINTILDNDVSFFRDKTVTAVNPKDIQSFSLNNNLYQKVNGTWQRNGLSVASELVNTLTTDLSNLEGIAFADTQDYNSIKAITPELSIKISTSTKDYSFYYVKYKQNTYIIDSSRTEYLIALESVLTQLEQIDANF